MVPLGNLLGGGRGGHLILAAFAFLLVLAYVPWVPDALLPKWGVVWLAGAVSGVWLAWARPTLDRIDVAALALFAWAGISVLWSPDGFEATDALTGFGPLALLLVMLRKVDVGRARDFILPAAILAITVNLLTGWEPFGGFGNQNFLTEFLLIVAPLSLLTPFGLLIAPLCVGLALWMPGSVEWPIFGLWALLALLATRRRFVAEVGIGILLLAAILGMSESVELWTAAMTRFDLWAGTAAAWAHAPLGGHGIGSFDYVFPAYANAGMYFGLPPYSVESATYPAAAHNDVLQLGMELGLVGVALGAWLAWEVWRGSVGMNRVALLTALALATIGFPFQNPATVGAIALAAAASQSSPTMRLPRVLPALAVAGMCWLLFLLPVRTEAQAYLSSGLRYLQPEVIERPGSAREALANINAAYRLDAGHPIIRLQMFKAAALVDYVAPGAVSEDHLEMAWRIAQTASPLNSSLLMIRLAYLARHYQCPDACMQIASDLLGTAWRKQEVRWMVERIWKGEAV